MAKKRILILLGASVHFAPKYLDAILCSRKIGIRSKLLKSAENWLKKNRAEYAVLEATSNLEWLGEMHKNRDYIEVERIYFKHI